ncbi:MAG: M23 family metallopeptidase [Corallococcus sp.]|nr:M23 family metallopeptidase [Corallococcus sp.]
MDYEGIGSVICDAEESDWLDVSYSERKYANEPEKKRRNVKLKITKKVGVLAVAALCVAALCAMLFIDGNFSRDVFDAAKTAYSAAIFEQPQPYEVSVNIAIPCNVNLVEVSEDGVATFNGGRAIMSFTAGKVTEATEDSVTVTMDDDTSIVYRNLTEIYVAAGDDVGANALLGKYDGSFTTVICANGETVKQVVGSEQQLKWTV